MLDRDKIPDLVKHTTLAVYLHSRGIGAGKKRFLAALSIARASLTRAGYLAKGSDGKGVSGRVLLTKKGLMREKQHKTGKDRGATAKSRAFDALWDYAIAGTSKFQKASAIARKASKFSAVVRRKSPVAKRKPAKRPTRSKKTLAKSAGKRRVTKARTRRMKRSKKARRR